MVGGSSPGPTDSTRGKPVKIYFQLELIVRRVNPVLLRKISVTSKDFLAQRLFSLGTIRERAAREEAGEYLAEPKYARGVVAENFFLVSAAQLESGDGFNRALIAHVKAVVASHHHAVSSHEVD
jgi:hypothetical protein